MLLRIGSTAKTPLTLVRTMRQSRSTGTPWSPPIGDDGHPDPAEVQHQYAVTRRRFRRLNGRQPRRFRFQGVRKGHTKSGRGNSPKRFRKKSGWTFLSDDGAGALCPSCSGIPDPTKLFFGGAGAKKRPNPNGLKCDNCKSPFHLWRKCDAANAAEYIKNREASKGQGRGRTHLTLTPQTLSRPSPPSSVASDRSSLLSQLMPGMTTHHHAVGASQGAGQVSQVQSSSSDSKLPVSNSSSSGLGVFFTDSSAAAADSTAATLMQSTPAQIDIFGMNFGETQDKTRIVSNSQVHVDSSNFHANADLTPSILVGDQRLLHTSQSVVAGSVLPPPVGAGFFLPPSVRFDPNDSGTSSSSTLTLKGEMDTRALIDRSISLQLGHKQDEELRQQANREREQLARTTNVYSGSPYSIESTMQTYGVHINASANSAGACAGGAPSQPAGPLVAYSSFPQHFNIAQESGPIISLTGVPVGRDVREAPGLTLMAQDPMQHLLRSSTLVTDPIPGRPSAVPEVVVGTVVREEVVPSPATVVADCPQGEGQEAPAEEEDVCPPTPPLDPALLESILQMDRYNRNAEQLLRHANVWKDLHKIVDHTVLIPTLGAFQALGEEVLEKIAADREMLCRIFKHHVFGEKIALLVQSDTMEVNGRDSRGVLVTSHSYHDSSRDEGAREQTCFSLVVERDGRRVMVVNDSTTTTRRCT